MPATADRAPLVHGILDATSLVLGDSRDRDTAALVHATLEPLTNASQGDILAASVALLVEAVGALAATTRTAPLAAIGRLHDTVGDAPSSPTPG